MAIIAMFSDMNKIIFSTKIAKKHFWILGTAVTSKTRIVL